MSSKIEERLDNDNLYVSSNQISRTSKNAKLYREVYG